MNVKQSHKTLLLWLLLIVMMLAIYQLIAAEPTPREMPFSEFVADVRKAALDGTLGTSPVPIMLGQDATQRRVPFG